MVCGLFKRKGALFAGNNSKRTGHASQSADYATDINPYVIEEAKNGLYSVSTINTDIANYKKSGGSKTLPTI